MAQLISLVIVIVLGLALTVAGVYYVGDALNEQSTKANASNLIIQGVQIDAALQLYYTDKAGQFPAQLSELVTEDYLKELPPGAESIWDIDAVQQIIYSPIGDSDNEDSVKICVEARRQIGMSNPETIYRCDGSDAPGGVLELNDPCCIR